MTDDGCKMTDQSAVIGDRWMVIGNRIRMKLSRVIRLWLVCDSVRSQ